MTSAALPPLASPLRRMALAYAAVLFVVAGLNHVPGLRDADGLVLGVFALDAFDDLLHLASALWALAAALLSARAARLFLLWFGALYLGDGMLGLLTGVGFLDAGILLQGPQSYGLVFRVLANAPHLALGGIALTAGLAWRR